MIKKLWLVAVVIGAVVINYLLIFALMPFFQQMVGIGIQGAEGPDFNAFRYFMQSLPLFFFSMLPGVVGIVAIVLILRSKETAR